MVRQGIFYDTIGCPQALTSKLGLASDAEALNEAVFIMVFSQFYSLVTNAITADGMEGGLDELSAKRSLINLGGVSEFKLFDTPMNLPCGHGATISAQGYAKYLYGYTMNGKCISIKCFVPHSDTTSKEFNSFLEDSFIDIDPSADSTYKGTDGFFLKLNPIGTPLLPVIVYYAKQVADTLRVLETQRFWMRKPGMFFTDEASKNKINKMIEDINNNEVAISVPRALLDGNAKIFQDFVFPATEHKETKDDIEFYKKEFLQLIGIDGNASPDKAANLTNDEVHADGKISSFNIHSIVDYLNKQQEMINENLGINVKWKVNEEALNDGVNQIMSLGKESEEKADEV